MMLVVLLLAIFVHHPFQIGSVAIDYNPINQSVVHLIFIPCRDLRPAPFFVACGRRSASVLDCLVS